LPLVHPKAATNGYQVAAQDSISLPRHRWYFLKEAFSPDLVKSAIREAKLEPTSLVVDPFCGSGTVPLTAVSLGFRATAFEVNPFLCFVARAKLSSPQPRLVKSLAATAEHGIADGAPSLLEGFSTFTPRDQLEKWLFNTDVLRGFEGGWQAISMSRDRAADLVRLCLIGAAMDCCNAAKDGKCLRYKTDWPTLSFSRCDLLKAFRQRLNEVLGDIDTPLPARTKSIYLADARSSINEIFLNQVFQLCVTSPPYLNSFDYSDVYRPELFLGKFVRSMTELRALRQHTVRSHVQAKWKDPIESTFGDHYKESLSSIIEQRHELWNRRIPLMIQAYFEDMKAVLRRLRKRADDNASAWIVISTSSYAGVELPVDLIIADIGSQVGWSFREVSVIRYLRRVSVQQWTTLSKRDDGPYLRESVVIFDAKPRKGRISLAPVMG
jgi:hypothetical protein